MTTSLPLFSKDGLIGFATVPADDFTKKVLLPMRWNVNADGYPTCRKGGHLIYLHKLVYARYHGSEDCEVDHEDGNKRNALPSNLRKCTRSVNIANSGKRATNKSGYKGVSWDKANTKWRATIMANYICFNLGRYADKEDAARAVNEAYRQYFPTVRIPNPEAERKEV